MYKKGFTLIELLVVVAIIGILATIVLSSLSGARKRAQITRAQQDMLNIQKALELYYLDNNRYPISTGWDSHAPNYGGHDTSGTNAYIRSAGTSTPMFTPNYMSVLPEISTSDDVVGFLYRSDGSGYKLLLHDHNGNLNFLDPDFFPEPDQKFYDPYRPTWSYMLCEDGNNSSCSW